MRVQEVVRRAAAVVGILNFEAPGRFSSLDWMHLNPRELNHAADRLAGSAFESGPVRRWENSRWKASAPRDLLIWVHAGLDEEQEVRADRGWVIVERERLAVVATGSVAHLQTSARDVKREELEASALAAETILLMRTSQIPKVWAENRNCKPFGPPRGPIAYLLA